MFSPIEEIKSRTDIVELVQGYMKLQKAGANYKANCPFHSEKTPSFYVTPSRQIWHCFGCGKGGDVFKFIMEIEGHDFPEALRLLALRAGVEIKREDPYVRSLRNRLYDVCEEAATIFERNLLQHASAKAYLKKRGMKEITVRSFRIGFAPQSWDYLLNLLSKKGFKKEEIEQAGLAVRSEDRDSWYDRFRSRIMFPITDPNGRVIGFGGRIFSAEGGETAKNRAEAKYMNSPATPIYDKSKVLYGFDKAKQEIRNKDTAVIVEGYMDCVMSHQAGVLNTVAVSGTALTQFQLQMLRRLAGTIVSSFDTDSAGDSATKRSLALAAQFEFVRKVAQIPTGKDPADTACENPELWVQAVSSAEDVVSFYFHKAFRDYSTERAEGKKAIAALVLPYVSELSDEIEKAHWVGELSRRLGAPETAIWDELRRKGKRAGEYVSGKEEPAISQAGGSPTRRTLLEERFLSLYSLMKEKGFPPPQDFSNITFSSALHHDLFQFLSGTFSGELAPLHKSALEMLKFKGEVNRGQDAIAEELAYAGRELEKICVKEELMRTAEEIQKLERQGAHEAVKPLLETFQTLTKKLNILK